MSSIGKHSTGEVTWIAVRRIQAQGYPSSLPTSVYYERTGRLAFTTDYSTRMITFF